MSKRGNENAQLRPDEVEALNDRESSSGGTFVRAPPEELAQRRIIKLTKRPVSGQPLNFGATSVSNASGTEPNPFGGFSGLVTSSAVAPNPFGGFSGLVTSSAVAPNPFGGFSGLVTSSATAPSAAIFSPFNAFGAVSTAPNGNFEKNVAIVPTGIVSSANPPNLESDYKKKMRKLNTSILSWMDRQIIDNPLSIWKDGLKDYVRYSADISNKYAGALNPNNADCATFSIETKHTNISSDTSTSSSMSVPIPSVSLSTNSDTVSKNATTFNWSVPGLSTALKSSTAPPAMSFSVPSFSIPVNTTFSSGIDNSASDPQGFSSSATIPSTGDDEDGEPIMEAEKVLRNDDDKDDIICDCNCKLHRFDTGKGDDGKGEWIDVGKGIFRVTKCTESGRQRMLVRNSVGKIIFNAAFYKGMKVDKKGKGMLSFGVVADVSGGLKTFLLKVKETDADVVYSSMQSAISSFH